MCVFIHFHLTWDRILSSWLKPSHAFSHLSLEGLRTAQLYDCTTSHRVAATPRLTKTQNSPRGLLPPSYAGRPLARWRPVLPKLILFVFEFHIGLLLRSTPVYSSLSVDTTDEVTRVANIYILRHDNRQTLKQTCPGDCPGEGSWPAHISREHSICLKQPPPRQSLNVSELAFSAR